MSLFAWLHAGFTKRRTSLNARKFLWWISWYGMKFLFEILRFSTLHSPLHHCSIAWSSLTAAEVYYAHNLSAHDQNFCLWSAIWLCSAKEVRCFNFIVYQVGRAPSHKNIKLKDKWLLLQKIYISARTNTGNNYLWIIAIISWINKVFLHSNQSNYQGSINGSIATQFLELWQRISCKSLFVYWFCLLCSKLLSSSANEQA